MSRDCKLTLSNLQIIFISTPVYVIVNHPVHEI